LDNFIIPRLVSPNIWYGAASKFNEPFVYGFVFLSNKRLVNNVKDYTLSCIACNILNQYVAEVLCQEYELGYVVLFNVSNMDGIITLCINGLNYNYTNYFYKVLDTIKNIKIDKNIIKMTIDKFRENIINLNNISPWDYANYILNLQQYKYSYKIKERLKIIDELLQSDYIVSVLKRIKRISQMIELSITMVIYGNISNKDIPTISSTFKPSIVPLPLIPTNTEIKHPNRNEENKCIMLILPCGKYSVQEVAKYIILSNLLEQPTYDQLRTKEQLGYLVKSSLTYDNLNYYINSINLISTAFTLSKKH
jgi:secreted Zn-dependent insulinase-like peptidase